MHFDDRNLQNAPQDRAEFINDLAGMLRVYELTRYISLDDSKNTIIAKNVEAGGAISFINGSVAYISGGNYMYGI